MTPPDSRYKPVKYKNITLPWRYAVPTKDLWFSHFFLIVLEIYSIQFFYSLISQLNSKVSFSDYWMALVPFGVFLIGSFCLIFKYNYNLIMATTMEYYIFDDAIGFQWGYFKVKKVIIPFEDVQWVSLVEWKKSKYSRIHFGVTGDYKILKWNFDKIDTNHHLTFQRIKNGPEMVELINTLRARNKIDGK